MPSFINDSPSNKILNLVGVPSSFKSATTATGSVADIIEENIKTADQQNSEP